MEKEKVEYQEKKEKKCYSAPLLQALNVKCGTFGTSGPNLDGEEFSAS